jgi:hypothetical protein
MGMNVSVQHFDRQLNPHTNIFLDGTYGTYFGDSLDEKPLKLNVWKSSRKSRHTFCWRKQESRLMKDVFFSAFTNSMFSLRHLCTENSDSLLQYGEELPSSCGYYLSLGYRHYLAIVDKWSRLIGKEEVG